MFTSFSASAPVSTTTECDVFHKHNIKTEPEQHNEIKLHETYDYPMNTDQHIKTESLLYADHIIQEEMVIGPTEIQFPVTGTPQKSLTVKEKELSCSRHISKQLLNNCKLELKDIAKELLCTTCDKWCLTTSQLQRHKQTHSLNNIPTFKFAGYEEQYSLIKPLQVEMINKSVELHDHNVDTEHKIKKELLLYGDHNIKEEMDIKSNDSESNEVVIQETYDMDIGRRIKTESILYTDHIIKEEMVIGPTEIQFPLTGSNHQSTKSSLQEKTIPCSKHIMCPPLFQCKLILKDVANNLLCKTCDKWFLTSFELKVHKQTHALTKIRNLKSNELIENGKKCTLKKPSQAENVDETAKKIKHSSWFACGSCKRSFERKMDLEIHITVAHSKSPFTCFCCNTCGKLFQAKPNYLHHVSNICVASKENRSKSEKTTRIDRIKNTSETHNKQSDKKQQNKENRRKSEKTTKMDQIKKVKNTSKTHYKISDNEQRNNKSFHCAICDKSFNFQSNLFRHKQVKHSNKFHSCHVCDKKFTDKRYLTSHIKVIHNKSQLFECAFCENGFPNSLRLKCHSYVMHNKGPALAVISNPCKVCDKDNSKCLLWQHKLIHRGERLKTEKITDKIQNNTNVFTCSICNKMFYKKSCLDYHKTLRDCRQTGNLIDISNTVGHYSSGRKLRGRSKLIRLGGEKKHQCDICRKSFWTRYELKVHKQRHQYSEEFICDNCHKVFDTKRKLVYHMRTHYKK